MKMIRLTKAKFIVFSALIIIVILSISGCSSNMTLSVSDKQSQKNYLVGRRYTFNDNNYIHFIDENRGEICFSHLTQENDNTLTYSTQSFTYSISEHITKNLVTITSLDKNGFFSLSNYKLGKTLNQFVVRITSYGTIPYGQLIIDDTDGLYVGDLISYGACYILESIK